MKTFKGDFYKFLNKIKNNENFALARFGDGELSIIENINIDLLNKGVGEFMYNANDTKYSKARLLLQESFSTVMDEYYIGVSCKCCVGSDKFSYMVEASKQPISNLTWANIFVNSNYNLFLKEFIPQLQSRKLSIVCHDQSNMNKMIFNIDNDMIFKVSSDAWINNLELIDILKSKIKNENIKDVVFLIAAGPFANILVHQLFNFDKNNTYLDIGSTLDKYLSLPLTRKYLNGGSTLTKTCIW
jgi:hypothetical protein